MKSNTTFRFTVFFVVVLCLCRHQNNKVYGASDVLPLLRKEPHASRSSKSRPCIYRLDTRNSERRVKRGRQPIGMYEKSLTRNDATLTQTKKDMSSQRPRGGDDGIRRWKRSRLVSAGKTPSKVVPENLKLALPQESLSPSIATSPVALSVPTATTKTTTHRKSLFQHYGIVLIVALTRTTTRVLHTIGKDWYTGYYLRTTLERVEHQYTKRYDVPACLRSVGRLMLHGSILFLLGAIMEWMVGLSHLPCRCMSGGCHWWCGLLWLVAVTGPGHAAGVAVAIWVSGLRLQLAAEYSSQKRPSVRRIISRPGTLLRWIVDPDQWFRELLASRKATDDPVRYALQPFDPDWRMFPATWSTLRVVQMIAIAKEMHGSDAIMHTFMRLVLFQQAFSDEWYRVLMCEKRVAWGIAVMLGYTLSTMALFWNMIRKPAHIVSSLSILMTTPSVLAVVISCWMNVLVYFERRQTHMATKTSLSEDDNNKFVMTDPIQSAIQQYQKANIIPLLSPRV